MKIDCVCEIVSLSVGWQKNLSDRRRFAAVVAALLVDY